MSISRKLLIFTACALLLLGIYGVVVFADENSGGYNPAESLNPTCAPGSAFCFVKSPLTVDDTYNNIYTGTIGAGTDLDGPGVGVSMDNIFLGRDTGASTTTGIRNIFFGGSAGSDNTTGAYNIFLGMNTGQANISGNSNSFIGTNAGYSNTTGGTNTFLGGASGYFNTTGSNNTLVGYATGGNITTGSNNIILGYSIDAPSATTDGQLSIGNLIFGTDIDGTGTDVSTGKIGIGIAAPSYQLHVKSSATYSTGSTTFTGAGLNDLTFDTSGYTGTGTHTYKVMIGTQGTPDMTGVSKDGVSCAAPAGITVGVMTGCDGVTFTFGATTGHTMGNYWEVTITQSGSANDLFAVDLNSTNLFAITAANGYVGVGDSTPDYKFEVEANSIATNYAASFFHDGNSSNYYGLQIQAGADSGTGTLIQFRDGDGTDVGEVTFSGTSTIYSTSSDRRMKDNIIDTHYSLADFMKLKVQDYTFRTEDSGRVYTGFIAQDLYQIYPDAVFSPEGDDVMWGVDYGRITPLIVAAVQEMNLNIEGIGAEAIDQTNSLAEFLRKFFENATNGIRTMFADKVQTKELCVEDVCVSRDQFLEMIQSSGQEPLVEEIIVEEENSEEETPIEGVVEEVFVEDVVAEEEVIEDVIVEEVIEEAPEELSSEEPISEPEPDPAPELESEPISEPTI